MILPNGRFCLIREKTVLQPGEQAGLVCEGGELLVVADSWRDEADHKARPNQPRASWGHVFRFAPLPANFNDWLLNVLADHARNEKIDHGPHHKWKRGGEDKHGWLSHPHVRALEVVAHA
jgi:hypothetical protein